MKQMSNKKRKNPYTIETISHLRERIRKLKQLNEKLLRDNKRLRNKLGGGYKESL